MKTNERNSNHRSVILVTGGVGYIGSTLIRDCSNDPAFTGSTIRIYDNLSRGRYSGLMDLPKGVVNYEFVDGDILDRENLLRSLKGVTTIIHLAALVDTPLGFGNNSQIQQVNQWGTASVVEAALQAGVQRLIYTSSASVYGTGRELNEDSPCNPIGPYSIAKLAGEREITAAVQRGLNPTILRLGSTYGNAPNMRFDIVANKFAFLAGTGRQLVIHGTGDQIRPLIHVDDASAAIRFAVSHDETAGETYNIAYDNPSILDIAETIRDIAPETGIRYTGQDILNRISFSVNSDKALEAGMQQKVRLADGLRTMIDRLGLSTFPAAVHAPEEGFEA